MPYEELLDWIEYFERRPIGWREDERTHKLLQVQGVKEKPWAIFSSLRAIHKREEERKAKLEGPDMSTLRDSVLFQNIMRAKGGDQIDAS